jgi:hypothetical protein
MMRLWEVVFQAQQSRAQNGSNTGFVFLNPKLIIERSELGTGTSIKAKFEGVNLLYAAITHQKRRVIRSQPYPEGENIAELRKVLQAYNVLQYAISYTHAHQFSGAAVAGPHVNIFSVMRPLVVAELLPLDET